MNRLIAFGVLAFSITLAVLIGQRLSDQAMAVIVGSVIGVVASMPMTAVVLWLTLRSRETTRYAQPLTRSEPAPREEAPRIMVIQPQPYAAPQYVQSTQYQQPVQGAYLNPPSPMATYSRPAREFKIVGQEDFHYEDRDALV